MQWTRCIHEREWGMSAQKIKTLGDPLSIIRKTPTCQWTVYCEKLLLLRHTNSATTSTGCLGVLTTHTEAEGKIKVVRKATSREHIETNVIAYRLACFVHLSNNIMLIECGMLMFTKFSSSFKFNSRISTRIWLKNTGKWYKFLPPVVSETTMGADFLQTLKIFTQLSVQALSKELCVLTILNILLSV